MVQGRLFDEMYEDENGRGLSGYSSRDCQELLAMIGLYPSIGIQHGSLTYTLNGKKIELGRPKAKKTPRVKNEQTNPFHCTNMIHNTIPISHYVRKGVKREYYHILSINNRVYFVLSVEYSEPYPAVREPADMRRPLVAHRIRLKAGLHRPSR